MKSFSRETEKTVIDFLLTDLEMALTFLNLRDITRSEEIKRRNHENAQNAYNQIVHTLQAVTLSDEQQELFDKKLSLIRQRLNSAEDGCDNRQEPAA